MLGSEGKGTDMKLEILGRGCPKCHKLSDGVEEAAKMSGKPYELVKVTEIEKIMGYGVMSTPGLVVDEKVVSTGKVLTAEEIGKLL